ncbi:MAG: DUF1289 domain-containing protein [Rhizobiales bacterium]|nr:DUF1289 domain-containing protein [Hyphomicrobiales bacterium]
MSEIASPCTKICVLDSASGVCLGCGRSTDEIERWLNYTSAERAHVMASLPKRLAALRRNTLAKHPVS